MCLVPLTLQMQFSLLFLLSLFCILYFILSFGLDFKISFMFCNKHFYNVLVPLLQFLSHVPFSFSLIPVSEPTGSNFWTLLGILTAIIGYCFAFLPTYSSSPSPYAVLMILLAVGYDDFTSYIYIIDAELGNAFVFWLLHLCNGANLEPATEVSETWFQFRSTFRASISIADGENFYRRINHISRASSRFSIHFLR